MLDKVRYVSPRRVQLPFEHLLAEIAAAPIASATSLHLGLRKLDADAQGQTAQLWRGVERDLVQAFPGVSLDELVSVRDAVWFSGPPSRSQSLTDFLRSIAKRWLERRGSVVVPREPGQDDWPSGPRSALARRSLMWATFALPVDLLLATLDDLRQPVALVDLMCPAVARSLSENGFAETHLHLGASLQFGTLWSVLMARLAQVSRLPDLDAPGAVFNEGLELRSWLLRAAIARQTLASTVAVSGRRVQDQLYGPMRDSVRKWAGPAAFTVIIVALDDLKAGRLSPGVSDDALAGAYRFLCGDPAVAPFGALSDAARGDPIACLATDGLGSDPERVFLRAVLHTLSKDGTISPDPLLEQLFWQYIRVRNILYRHVTQRPLTPGLQWFVRFYGRMAAVRGNDLIGNTFTIDAAANTCGLGSGLRALEVRTSPGESEEEIFRLICDVADRTSPEEVGIVYHFTKSREGGAGRGQPQPHSGGTRADPTANATGMRYAEYFESRLREARSLATVLQRWPLSLEVVRGLDVCSDELAVPSWVLRQHFAIVRDAAGNAENALRGRRYPVPPPFRTTVHAGEDFVHLLTGLRNVDQAIEVFALREGDRLGHAVAIGLSPVDWAARAGRFPMPLEDRVLDLCWEWSSYGRGGTDPPPGRPLFLEHTLRELSHRWFGEVVDPYELELLTLDLATPEKLQEVG